MANQQPGLLGQFSSQSDFQPGADVLPSFRPSGFDFGMSQPAAGLGYGLLGNVSALVPTSSCADCQQGDQACAQCDASSTADDDDGSDGHVIKAQYPIPVPGLLPPPFPTQPGSSTGATAGNPSAWWNDDVRNLPGRFGNWVQSHVSPEVEEVCWERYMLDTIDCNLKKAYAGADAARTCHEQAAAAYSDCKKKGRQSDIPRYDRN